jgi:HK97 family phage major capsid protein
MLLKQMAALGFVNDKPDLAAIEKYLTDENITLNDGDSKPIDVAKAWATEAKPARTVVVDTEDISELKKQAKAWRDHEAANTAAKMAGAEHAPQRFNIGNAHRKAYDARAARGDADTHLPDADSAEIVGAWAKCVGAGPNDFDGKKEAQEICQKANVSYDFASGGFTIPSILSDQMINIRPRYSALASLMTDMPIAPQGEAVPRSIDDVTVYSPGEGVAATESNPTGDQVRLTPFEMVALTTVTRTMLAQSNIDFGNFVTGKMLYATGKKREQIYFLGDASSTYFNQVGLLGKVSAQVVAAGGTWTIGTNATNAEYHSACVRGAGNLWSELTYQNYMDVIAHGAAMIEDSTRLAWAVHPAHWFSTMVPLIRSKGGVTSAEVVNGVPVFRFEGFPVIHANALPAASANGSVCAWFGDFGMCTKIGTVLGGVQVESNPYLYWHQRKVGYQSSVCYAQNCHDLGTANSTQPDQTVPMAFLVTAES